MIYITTDIIMTTDDSSLWSKGTYIAKVVSVILQVLWFDSEMFIYDTQFYIFGWDLKFHFITILKQAYFHWT